MQTTKRRQMTGSYQLGLDHSLWMGTRRIGSFVSTPNLPHMFPFLHLPIAVDNHYTPHIFASNCITYDMSVSEMQMCMACSSHWLPVSEVMETYFEDLISPRFHLQKQTIFYTTRVNSGIVDHKETRARCCKIY